MPDIISTSPPLDADAARPTEAPLSLPEANNSRARRVRKTRPLGLDVCICGNAVSAAEIEMGDLVMSCRVPGCETKWVRPLPYLNNSRI